MITAIVTFYVEGDTYDEMIERSKEMLASLLDITVGEVLDRVNIELNIVENEPLESDMSYAAEMIARIKNVR